MVTLVIALQQERKALEQEIRALLALKYKRRGYKQELEKLVRANVDITKQRTDKTVYLSEKALKLLKAVLEKLFKGETVLLNHKYISKITRCHPNQNNNILKELARILDIKYHRLLKVNGVYFSRHLHFQLVTILIKELSLVEEGCSQSHQQEIVSTYTNNNKITNSNNRSSKSTFLKKQEPKSLFDMYQLLDQSIFDELRSKADRDFSNNFISQRVLAMSKKPQLQTRNFKTREGFIAYMSLALKYELHDAVKTANIDFRLRANIKEYDNESCVKKVKPPQEELILPKGIWGEVLKKLIAEFGIDTYKNWFSKLTANVDEVTKTIRLKASSNFIKDWIERNYQCTMEKFITDFNFTW